MKGRKKKLWDTVITEDAVQALQLQEGNHVSAVIKSTEVMVEKDV